MQLGPLQHNKISRTYEREKYLLTNQLENKNMVNELKNNYLNSRTWLQQQQHLFQAAQASMSKHRSISAW